MPNTPCQVEVNGIALAYDDVGTGEPLVFIHGAVSDRRFWTPQIDDLSNRYRCIALDQRYFGRSWPGGDRPFELSTHSDDLVEFLRKVVSAPAHIVATSYGAAVALAAACGHPHHFKSLFLNEPSLTSLLSDPEDLVVLFEARKDLGPVVAAVADQDLNTALELFCDWVVFPGAFSLFPHEFKVMLSENARTIPLGLSAPPPTLTTAKVGELTIPVTLTTGAATKPFYSVQVRAAHRAIRHSRFLVIPDAHHGASFEKPAAFNAALLGHLCSRPD
jgi:pimeloyl-ACP methyl ester carboxylesterase